MKKMLKPLYICFSGLFLLLCLSGCRTYIPGTEYSDTRDVMLKQNTWLEMGQSAAYYNDKIYYISQENGQDGIHSMNKDGTDVQFVCSTPKISRLIVREGCIYYVGVKEIYKGVKLFGLFKYTPASSETEEISYTDSPSSVYDAYVTEDGAAYVLEMGNVLTSYAPRKLLYISPKPDDMAASTVMTYDKDKCELWQNGQILYIHENAVFQDNDPDMEPANFIDQGPYSFLDAATGTALMDNLEEAYYERYFKVLFKQDDVIWCAMENTLLTLNANTAEIITQYAFDDTVKDMNLTYFFKQGDIAYLVFEKAYDDEEPQKKEDNTSLLYSLNLSDSTFKQLGEFDEEKVLLHIGEGSLYWAEGSKIICNSLNAEEIGDTLYLLEFQDNIVKDNLFETAGDWLLVYKNANAAEAETNKLLYKINLNIQAVIKIYSPEDDKAK